MQGERGLEGREGPTHHVGSVVLVRERTEVRVVGLITLSEVDISWSIWPGVEVDLETDFESAMNA